MEGFTFHKNDRLCSQKLIGELFTFGDSFLVYPLKVVLLKSELNEQVRAQAAFSVSKRNFKRAVIRNLLKRRMREAYRLQKPGFCLQLEENNLHIAVMFIYVGKDILEYIAIEKAMTLALKRVVAKFRV